MNDKIKKALKIAGTAGLCALLFACGCGLGYCSAQKTGEPTKVLTEKTRKGEQITTNRGGYSGWKFTIDNTMPQVQDTYVYDLYSLDRETYTPTLRDSGSATLSGHHRDILLTKINDIYSSSRTFGAVTDRTSRWLLSIRAYTNPYGDASYTGNQSVLYLTFIEPNYTTYIYGVTNTQDAFVVSGLANSLYALPLAQGNYVHMGIEQGRQYYISDNKVGYYLFGQPNNYPETLTFQDIISYYKEDGYADGYEDGYESGSNVGYWQGYNDGVGSAGNFTSISGNINATFSLADYGSSTTTTWYSHGLTDPKYGTMLQFRDQNDQSWTVYFEDGIAPNQPSGTRSTYINVYSQSTQEYLGWIAFGVRDSSSWNFKAQQVNTFSFNFATVTNVLGRTLTDSNILIWGWDAQQIGYEAGYSVGYADGFEQTNTKNVFSLFTDAFGAVASFFEIKVFGFLPLYWFFLIPVFVTVITLLLRMVKH